MRCFLLAVFLEIFIGCNPTKKLLPHEYLVDQVEVKNTKETELPRENFEAFYRQKPNRKLLRKFHFYVWWYNLFNDQKIREQKIKRNLKYDVINAKRVQRTERKNIRRARKGKKPRIPRLKDKDSPMLIESVRDIGEPAVVFDSLLTEQTRLQLSKYLFSKGFFNNTVTDTVELSKNSKRAVVKYMLYPRKPYMINKITYKMDDEQLGALILKDTINTLIRAGMQYDADKLLAEQQRITDMALNNGYFYFENAYINFDVDSANANHTVSIKVILNKFAKPYSSTNDSLIYTDHPKYKIENVYIITDPVIGNVSDVRFTDTLYTRKPGTVFLLNKPLSYRRFLITNNIGLYRNQLFRRDTAQQTYKQLLGLGTFRNVTIQFLKNPDYNNRLDCYIICNPLIRQSLTAETEGTNTSGNLGVDGNIVYQNRNFFRAGELVELKIQGAITAQQQFNNQGTGNGLSSTFNTVQFGPELTFSVPRAFFPFSLIPFKKEMAPRTYVKTAINYQSRPEFNRTITSIDYGFNFRTNNNTLKHDFIPFEAYYVHASLTDTFQRSLAALNDAFLANSFKDHITTLSKYGLTYTSKENSNTSRRPVNYIRWNIQSSGNILRSLFNHTGREKDSLGSYRIFNTPFAQFVRTDIDYRLYVPIRKRSRLVYRFAAGLGKPLNNLKVLPYEQSFFSGGPNSVRAWRARTLGPGGYDPTNSSTRYDKIGDMLLEANVEYRFHIIKSFNGAFFVDAGNIWRLEPDDSKPGGEFKLNTFADQIAIGGGFGIRWDLTFFVLRLDLAAPLKDPKFAPGNRWTFNKQPWQNTVANFGIGYPF